MVEDPIDELSSCKRIMGAYEALSWEAIKMKFDLGKDFSRRKGLRYSCENLKEDG